MFILIKEQKTKEEKEEEEGEGEEEEEAQYFKARNWTTKPNFQV